MRTAPWKLQKDDPAVDITCYFMYRASMDVTVRKAFDQIAAVVSSQAWEIRYLGLNS